MLPSFRFSRVLSTLLLALTTALVPLGAHAQTNRTFVPVADAYVQDGTSATKNFGTAAGLYVKKNASANTNRWAYIKFDLSSLPATVTSAKLRLYGKNGTAGYTGTDTVSGVTDTTWTETGITWNTKPMPSAAITSSAVTDTAQYVEWDVTPFIQARQNAGSKMVSLLVTMDAVTANADTYVSRENVTNTPQLVIVVPAPPAGPTTLSATAGSNEVDLTWNASDSATSYNVKRATHTGGPYTTVATGQTGLTYADTTAVNGTTYYYVVTAVNANGEGGPSPEASAKPFVQTTVPRNLTATADNSQVQLAWTGSSDATSYTIKRSTVQGGPYSATATGLQVTSYRDTNVNNGTKYYYVVTATGANGESSPSNEAAATPTGTATAGARADSYVTDGSSAGINYGTATYLYVKKNKSAGSNRTAYLTFPLPALNGSITSVKLRLYGKHQGTSYSATDSVYSVSDTTWTESGITFSNRPAASATALSKATITSTAQYYQWDVTSYVKAQQAAGATSVSLAVSMDNVPADAQNDQFYSKENSSPNAPQLVVTATPVVNVSINFQPASSAVPSGYTADTGQPYNSARGFGWVREDSISNSGQHVPLDLTPNTRDRKRASVTDPRLNTIIHMQYPADTVKYPDPATGPAIVRTPGAWDYDLPNGDYSVTMSVGDQPGSKAGYDSQHTINVVGVNAINQFQSTASQEYMQATVTVTVTNGKLTVDAIGGNNTKLDYLTVTNQGIPKLNHPSIAATSPKAGEISVYRDTAIKADLNLPNVGGINPSTATSSNIYLIAGAGPAKGTSVPGNITIDGAGGAITFQPTVLLDPGTPYTFVVTSGLKDQSGTTFNPFSATFTTGASTSIGTDSRVQFSRTPVYSGDGATSLTISPDNKLYAAMITGNILRWTINADGTLSNLETFTGLSGRALTGLVFDPSNPNVLWITSNAPLVFPAPDFTGKIVKLTLTGPGFVGNMQDYIVGLPRSARDHLSESLAFGPDGKLYLSQGSDSAMGAPDNAWYNRPERLLNASVLQIDPTITTNLPINVQTEDYNSTTGSYNPYAPDAPVKLYATGIRNSYDLVWHSNGNLYCPTNGSAAGGNTPASPTGVTPVVPALLNGPTQDDYLFKVVQGGYYGHPNPLRGNYVLNGGNPTANVDPAQVIAGGNNAGYPVGTQPDPNYRGYTLDMGRNRSPDGAIEYKSNTFGGALIHKLLTVEYSAGQDIVAVPFDANGNATADTTTQQIETQVFGGLTNPLDLTEDVRNGSLYVSEFLNGGTSGRITLLRPNVAAISASPTQLVYSGNQNAGQTAAQTVTISNIGSQPLTIPAGAFSLAGTDAAQFVITATPTLPVTLAAGQSVTASAAFNPTSLGPKHALLQVQSSDSATAVLQIRLDGVGLDPSSNATSEPSLQYILDTYGYPVNAGNPDPSKNSLPGTTSAVGDEVLMPRLQKAGPGAVTITPLAAFGPNTDPSGICANFGWYLAGNPDSAAQMFSIPNSSAKSMTPVINGTLTFDPGTARFGLYAQWPYFSSTSYFEEDNLNAISDPVNPHHMRFYPLKNQSGQLVPNTYIVTNEDAKANSGASNQDFNDLVLIVSNIAPAVGQIATENLDGLPSATRFIFNRIGTLASPPTNHVHDQSTIRIRNIGLDPVNVTGLPITGPWILNGTVALPTTLAPNATLDVPVKFVAESGRVTVGSVSVQTSAPDQSNYPVTLAGYWQTVSENNQEPEINESINQVFGWTTNMGFTTSLPKNMGGRVMAYGDEVLSPYWKQAVSALPVSVQQIQAFHTYNPPNNNARIYWYGKPAGTVNNLNSPTVPVNLIFANNAYDSQSYFPRLDGQTSGVSAGSFTPADGAVFGFNIDDQVPLNHTTTPTKTGEWSDNLLNYHGDEQPGDTGGDIGNGCTEPCGHHMRFWPLKDASGTIVPDTYIMSIDYGAVNYDFQDVMYIISNIKPENEDLAAYVNPFIGTGQGVVVTGGTSSGATYPGPQVPFGMVSLSPQTPASTTTGKLNGGGYDYGQNVITGFAHTHLSGPGGPAYGDIPFLPTTGAVSSTDPAVYGSAFSHSTESATPGYYRVNLDTYGVGAELTASTHVGWHRYTFPAGAQANVLINVSGSLRGAAASSISIVNSTTVEGSVSSYGYYNTSTGLNPHPYTVYFSAQFSQPFAAYGTWNGSTITAGSTSATGTNAGGYITFGTPSAATAVVAKVGISFVSVQGARNNLTAEASGFNFDAASQTGHSAWNTLLQRVAIGGANGDQRASFYTALYHSLLFPNTFSDADGSYIGFDNVVHNTGGRVQYANFSLWDTYRTEHPLLALVAPKQNVDMMSSLMSIYREGGWLPRWPFANAETNDLMGDPALPVLADAYAKGQLGTESAEAVYQAMVHNATQVPATGSQFQGRLSLDSYVTNGYVPYVPKNAAPQLLWGGSIGPEYALSDGALSLMATGLGHTSDAQTFAARAHGYRTQFDAALGLTHTRDSTGAFVTPFSTTVETTFKEATAWQLTWMAPQDVNGLVTLMGGKASMAGRLDQFFAYGRLVSNPQDVIRNTWGLGSNYNQYNEPDFHAPYLYAYLQQPWKTSTIVRAAETLYTNSPVGIPGNDDLGETSAWYVMSSLGLYPTMPGANFYVVTSPLFKQAVITLDPAYYSASTLKIQAPAASAANAYIQSLSLNGQAISKSWINHSDIQSGANLVFGLGPKPSASWATGANAVPPAVLP